MSFDKACAVIPAVLAFQNSAQSQNVSLPQQLSSVNTWIQTSDASMQDPNEPSSDESSSEAETDSD